ncbi:MAG TPA: cysteine desulfurase [Verrucomicrobiales bacterium]|nr:cysteine desulfurase [Verrucomicrobiales bacterium]
MHTATQASALDLSTLRAQFPILQRSIGSHPLTYLDNAATSQKPAAVIDAISRFFRQDNANIHRGVHYLSVQATDLYDRARAAVAGYIGAREPREIIFVRGTTEAINLVARSFGGSKLEAGDEILLTVMEHHANIVPWQQIAAERGAVIRVVPVRDTGEIDLGDFGRLLSPRTRIASFSHASNALGSINPVAEMTRIAREHGAVVLIDGAQALPHGPIDVAAIDCDFYAFSGHKMFGPDGIGVLYGRAGMLNALPPYQSGGDMIERVSFTGTTFRAVPERFEAGTPHISGAIGLEAAVTWLRQLDWPAVHAHEQALLEQAETLLTEIPGIRLYGSAPDRVSLLSFNLEGVHPHDLGTILDSEGVAIRAGHHCTQPLMQHLGVPGTARASFALYNTPEEVERLASAVRRARHLFA